MVNSCGWVIAILAIQAVLPYRRDCTAFVGQLPVYVSVTYLLRIRMDSALGQKGKV